MRNIYFLICFFLTVGTIGFFSSVFDIDFTSSTAGGSSYGVEIATLRYPVYTECFDDVDDVVELRGKDGDYHYLSGLSNSRDNAADRAEEIKMLGYADAKVVDLNNEFIAEQIAGVLNRKKVDSKISQRQKISKQTVKKKKEIELAIGKLTNIGNAYFYTILLQKSKNILNAESFSPYNSVKIMESNGRYQYVLGRFEDVGDAKKYLKDKVQLDFPNAIVAVINKGKLAEFRDSKKPKVNVKLASTEKASYDMGRRMRGKEYLAYYYEMDKFNASQKPLYTIEIGAYDNKQLAADAVQKLKELGFANAKIKTPSASNVVNKKRISADSHYTIQAYASKFEMGVQRNDIEFTQTFDQQDELYRYFYGDYDNYWVCRRELREVRRKGFGDAFIVKL